MRVKHILLIGAALITLDLSAQDNSSKEFYALHKSYKKKIESDSATVNCLLKIAFWHLKASEKKAFSKSRDSVYYYGSKVREICKKNGYRIGEAKCSLLYSELAYDDFNDLESRKYAKEALKIFQKENYSSGIADAYIRLASAYQGKPDITSINQGLKAKQIYRNNGNKVKEGYAARMIAGIYNDYGNSKKALQYANESVELFAKAGYRKEELVNSLLFLEVLHYYSGNIKEAYENCIEALKLAEKIDPNGQFTSNCYRHLGKLYFYSGKSEEALAYLKKGLAIVQNYTDDEETQMTIGNIIQVLFDMNNSKEALLYLKKLENYSNLSFESKVSHISISINVYVNLKEHSKAQKYVKQAKILLSNNPENLILSRLYLPLGRYYYNIKDYVLSRHYYEKHKVWAEKGNNKFLLHMIYEQLFKLDSINGNYLAAIKNLRLSQKYQDSVFNDRSERRIEELKIHYDVEKKEKDLLLKEETNKLLHEKSELQQEKLARSTITRNVSVFGTAIMLVLIGLLYNRYKSNREKNRLLELQQAEISNSNHVLKLLVTEKEWLLKEIHHRVKNNLHVIMSLLNSQSYFLEDKAAVAAIKNSQHRIQSMSLIHQKLYMSDNLTAVSMPDYVNELMEYLRESFSEQKNIKFHIRIEEVEMDVSQAVPIGLILNEAITNCFKHAFPGGRGSINVTLTNTIADTFCLEILDEGVGLPPGFDLNTINSLGMKLIKGLAEDLDGILNVESSSHGTSIKIEFIYKPLLFERN